jgi:hypothetical protein
MKIELKGWKAIAALVIIAAAIVWKFAAERSTLATEAADEIKFWLRAEYLAAGMEGFDLSQLSEEEAQAKGEELLSLSEIEFSSIGARGRGDDIVVKVEVQVAGKDPPDGRRTRYFRMSHSTVTGWRVRWEASAFSYYLKLF